MPAQAAVAVVSLQHVEEWHSQASQYGFGIDVPVIHSYYQITYLEEACSHRSAVV